MLGIHRASLILSFIHLSEPSSVPGVKLGDCKGEQKKNDTKAQLRGIFDPGEQTLID